MSGLLTPLARLRMQRDAEHLYALGARATFEFLLELAQQAGATPELASLLAGYRWLSPALLRSVGGDRFPPRLLREVA